MRVLVDRRWPRGLDKANAAIDRWERGVAPSIELQRWFGGRRSRWAEFRKQYARELGEHREVLACWRALAAERPLTLLFAAGDQAHNSAVVLRDILASGREGDDETIDPLAGRPPPPMSHAEQLRFLNSVLASSRIAVKEAKAILKSAAAQIIEVQRHEAYACAVLIQLIKSLGGEPDRGVGSADEAAVTGLAQRLARLVVDQHRVQYELRCALPRVTEDRVRFRLQKLLIARDRNIRHLDGEAHLALAQSDETRQG